MTISLRKVEAFSDAAIQKLESSGITEAQARALGIYSVANAQTLNGGFEVLPALVLPYFSAEKRALTSHPARPPFYRIRYLGERNNFNQATDKKPLRYTQPSETGVAAYFPINTDWARISQDPEESLIITEGEFKAAKACVEGFPTIGLGGVYSFRSIKDGHFLLPELEAFVWNKRRVNVIFDSDYVQKPNVCAAINALAQELAERGADVLMVPLPNVYEDPERKTGLDDFLVERKDVALVALLRQAEPITMVRRLWEMNDELVYVKTPGLVVAQANMTKMACPAFTGHSEWSTQAVPERKIKPNGEMSYVKGEAANNWLKWPMRRSVARITYQPGDDLYCEAKDGALCLNEWEGWGCTPKKGNIQPWNDLLSFLFTGADKGFLEWFLDWCAYPIQYPGSKLFSAVVIHGRSTGTGKTLVGYTIGKIYGKNFTKIENKNLKRDFNGWAQNRQFILGDEISGTDKRSEADAFKTVITQEEVWINIKGVPEYQIPDCINYYFTSNHPDAFFIEDEDRRYAIHEVTQREPFPEAFYKEYEKWKEGDGPAALMYWLLQRDLSNFNPKAPAFKTAARSRMSMHGKSDLGVWCAELREYPDAHLRIGQMRHQKDLFTTAELLAMYQQQNDPGNKVTANGIGRALSTAGFVQVYKGAPVPHEGTQARYYVIRNREQWSKETKLKTIVANLKLSPVRI